MEMDQLIADVHAKMTKGQEQVQLDALKEAYLAGLANGQLGKPMPVPMPEDQTPFSQADMDALSAQIAQVSAKLEQALADDASDKAQIADLSGKLEAIKLILAPAPQPEPVPPVVVEPELPPVDQAEPMPPVDGEQSAPVQE